MTRDNACHRISWSILPGLFHIFVSDEQVEPYLVWYEVDGSSVPVEPRSLSGVTAFVNKRRPRLVAELWGFEVRL